jgi:hypothetical protein
MTNDELMNTSKPAKGLIGAFRKGAATGRHVTFSQHTDTRGTALDYIQASPDFDSLCCYAVRRLRIRHQSFASH